MRTTSQRLAQRANELRNAERINRSQLQEMVAFTSCALATLSQTKEGKKLLKEIVWEALNQKGN